MQNSVYVLTMVGIWLTACLGWAKADVQTTPDAAAASPAVTVPAVMVEDDLNPDSWLLHDLLQTDFAQSVDWQAPSLAHLLVPQDLKAMPGWSEVGASWPLSYRAPSMLGPSHKYLAKNFDIPLADHPLVNLYIDYFTGRGRWLFTRWLERSARYIPLMQPILSQYGLPQDLVYVAMIESGFSAHAHSSAKAVGYWQFVGNTGKLYGLKRDAFLDERRDFMRATHAAAQYLRNLYRLTGDWHLAWASYNAGPARVQQALQKYKTTNFWQLIEYKNSLAKETMHYVPKVIAAAMIAKNPSAYGFANLQPLAPLAFEHVTIDGMLDLASIANHTQVSLHTLRELNPALLRDKTPPHRRTVLRVPAGKGPLTAKISQHLLAQVLKKKPAQKNPVRRRKTLWSMAKRDNATSQRFKNKQPKPLPTLASGEALEIF